MFAAQDFIRRKRDGKTLDPEDIGTFITGIANKSVSDAQIAAFCMASLLKGLSITETAHLTRAMAFSGTVLKWPSLNGPVIDKHSTGGIGDKVSLMLAPIAAACGLYVPMIAGRGLGHTGGTVDKMEAIPGYNVHLAIADFQKTVATIGCSIIGQTSDFAPADGRMYAVRDVTGTVESISLITASILSKKLAAGLQGLVMDVKFGNGAFMPTISQAQELAKSLATVAEAAELRLKPVLTDMNQILGTSAGNAVEVREAVYYLTGIAREKRLHEVTCQLIAEMLILGGKANSLKEAFIQIEDVLDNGKAAEIFGKMIAAHGGPKDFIENLDRYLPKANFVIDIVADRDGILNAMDTRSIGMALVNLKAGRARVEDTIDLSIGLTDVMPLGTLCEKGKTVLARFHLSDQNHGTIAASSYLNALTISDQPFTQSPVIHVS